MAETPSAHTYQSVKPYLFSVAYRMTGSASDAEDLVQDAWLRYIDAGSPAVDSLRAYLTTVISRLTLDFLKSARVRREHYVGSWMPGPVLTRDVAPGPADSAEQREAVTMAFLMLLEQLGPEQRGSTCSGRDSSSPTRKLPFISTRPPRPAGKSFGGPRRVSTPGANPATLT